MNDWGATLLMDDVEKEALGEKLCRYGQAGQEFRQKLNRSIE